MRVLVVEDYPLLRDSLAADTEPGGWIEVRQLPDGALEVADSGPELAADELERIFDRMWRGDRARATSTASGVHCGIGLSLARALCDAMSMSLTVSSTSERVAFRIASRSGQAPEVPDVR